MIKVFISYVKDDVEIADKIYEKLKYMTDVDLWYDKKCLKPGENWKDKIEEAIKSSNYFLALMSTKSVNHIGYVQKELKIALEVLDLYPKSEIFIIPIRIEECEPLDEKLRPIQWVEFFLNEDKAMEEIMNVIEQKSGYLGRIDRAKKIIESIDHFTEEFKKQGKEVYIRMRATFTSMSNIAHFEGREVPDLFPGQAIDLDSLLVSERKSINNLIDLDNVILKCVCWPKIEFLSSKYYSNEQKQERVDLLNSFFYNSKEKYINRRQVICDEYGSDGNLLIINNNLVIVANKESGGYTETTVINDQQVIDVLIREYDNQFKRILKRKRIFVKSETEEKQNERMILDAAKMFEKEVKKWKDEMLREKNGAR